MMTNAITDWVLVLAPTDTFVASSQKYIYIYIWNWTFFYLFWKIHNFFYCYKQKHLKHWDFSWSTTTKASALTYTFISIWKQCYIIPTQFYIEIWAFRLNYNIILVLILPNIFFKNIRPITNPATSKTFKQKPWMMECGTLQL